MLSILNKLPESTTSDDINYVKNLFGKYGSIEYARNRAKEFTDAAKGIAHKMPARLSV